MEFVALILSIVAIVISIGNIWLSQIRSNLTLIWAACSSGSTDRYFVIKNHGPGTAIITKVRAIDPSTEKEIELNNEKDRKILPAELPSGATLEIKIDKSQGNPTFARVNWKDILGRKRSIRSYVFSSRTNTA